MRNLLPSDALHHLSQTSSGAFELDDVDIDKPVLEVAERIGPSKLDSAAVDSARTLWIKTGAWTKLDPFTPFNPQMTKPQWRAYLFWAARLAPSLPPEAREQLFRDCLWNTQSLWKRDDHPGLRATVQLLAFARIQARPSLTRSMAGSRAC